MGLLDGSMPNLANTLIGLFGASATLKRERSAYEPRTGTMVGQGTDSWAIKITPPEEAKSKDDQQVATGSFKTEVSAVALAAVGAPVPVVGMTLSLGGKDYKIDEVDPERSGDSVTTYVLTCVI